MSSTWLNPCGGALWRYLDDGRIEIQGLGVLSCTPDSTCAKQTWLTYQNWKSAFRASASRHNIPTSWLVAIAVNETGFLAQDPNKQRTVTSSDGYGSVGIMQPLPSEFTRMGYPLSARTDAAINIEAGARILSENLNRYNNDFVSAAAAYNAGHVCPTQSNISKGNVDTLLNVAGFKGVYARSAIRHQNTAVQLGVNRSEFTMAYAAAGFGVIALAGYFWLNPDKRPFS